MENFKYNMVDITENNRLYEVDRFETFLKNRKGKDITVELFSIFDFINHIETFPVFLHLARIYEVTLYFKNENVYFSSTAGGTTEQSLKLATWMAHLNMCKIYPSCYMDWLVHRMNDV